MKRVVGNSERWGRTLGEVLGTDLPAATEAGGVGIWRFGDVDAVTARDAAELVRRQFVGARAHLLVRLNAAHALQARLHVEAFRTC